ncbi:MAG: DUF4276 family protein [Burkholderiales bacterium]|nr:DUF4276 family protein [Burkholderiales bacterium]
MKELVFLLEEISAKAMLESLLPRILHTDIHHRFIPFEGKQDMEKQLCKRLRGYLNPQTRFIVLRDLDSEPDCKKLKEKLTDYCQQAGQMNKTLIRIACRELESFYLADLEAVGKALSIPRLTSYQNKSRFRKPDLLPNPSRELATLTKDYYQKISGSNAIGQFLDPENTRSSSFYHLIQGIRRMERELLKL